MGDVITFPGQFKKGHYTYTCETACKKELSTKECLPDIHSLSLPDYYKPCVQGCSIFNSVPPSQSTVGDLLLQQKSYTIGKAIALVSKGPPCAEPNNDNTVTKIVVSGLALLGIGALFVANAPAILTAGGVGMAGALIFGANSNEQSTL